FELLQMHLGGFVSKNEYGTACLWLDQIPEEYKEKSVKVAVFYSMFYAQDRAFEASHAWLARARALLDQDGKGEIGAQERALVGLAALNLLIRKDDVEALRALIRSGGILDGNAFGTIEYMDLNDSSIYMYRSTVHVMVKLFETDRDAFHKLKSYYNIFSTQNPGFMPLAGGEYFYERNRADEARCS
ncbi:MAG TPA: hypothetical protein PKE04_15495, partial [Clostridia bacterium]|nr:hypothetical protein [Clostridia bacterium]